MGACAIRTRCLQSPGNGILTAKRLLSLNGAVFSPKLSPLCGAGKGPGRQDVNGTEACGQVLGFPSTCGLLVREESQPWGCWKASGPRTHFGGFPAFSPLLASARAWQMMSDEQDGTLPSCRRALPAGSLVPHSAHCSSVGPKVLPESGCFSPRKWGCDALGTRSSRVTHRLLGL